MTIPKIKQMERAYGYDEVAIVPGDVTINPDQVNIDFTIGPFTFSVPIIASAMDAVVNPEVAILLHKLGALGVLNLDGIQARYEKPEEILDEIVHSSDREVTQLLQKIYTNPIDEKLVAQRVETIKGRCGLRDIADSCQYKTTCSDHKRGGSRYSCYTVYRYHSPPYLEKLPRSQFCRNSENGKNAGRCRQLRFIQRFTGADADRN